MLNNPSSIWMIIDKKCEKKNNRYKRHSQKLWSCDYIWDSKISNARKKKD